MKNKIKGKILFCMLVSTLFLCVSCVNTYHEPITEKPEAENSDETVKSLTQFTTIEKVGEDIYEFSFDGGSNIPAWKLHCTNVNNAIDIYDKQVADVFISRGGDAFDDGYYFVYDFDEKRASVYLNEEIYGMSIVSYYVDTDDFDCMKKAEHCYLDSESIDYLRDSGVIDMMKNDIEQIEEQVGEKGLTFENLNCISVSSIVNAME